MGRRPKLLRILVVAAVLAGPAEAQDTDVQVALSSSLIKLGEPVGIFVRVDGDSTDSAQMYEIELALVLASAIFEDGFEGQSTGAWSGAWPTPTRRPIAARC